MQRAQRIGMTTMGKTAAGWIDGFIGMAMFSATMPATRAAVIDFDPVILTGARAAIAGALGLALVLTCRETRPRRCDLPSLAIVAASVVVGAPLLFAIALQYISSARSLVFIGLLPLSTAIFGVLRGGERPPPAFWLFAGCGSALVAGYALAQREDAAAGGALTGDMVMFAAIVLAGLGYAEGGRLSRRLGGRQVISWALVISLPVTLSFTIVSAPSSLMRGSFAAWFGLAYLALFSQFIGFFFWYRGLAAGGIAAVGQLQLLQPFLGLGLAAALLREPVSGAMLVVTLSVAACVAGARKFA
jgi:drug/metabolite transporter (DMT)-like permease